MAFYRLEQLLNLYDGYRRVFTVGRQSLLLIQEEGQRYLLLNQCPHQQAPLHQGTINGGYLRCPFHGMEFNLATGAAKIPCNGTLERLLIKYDGNSLGVEL